MTDTKFLREQIQYYDKKRAEQSHPLLRERLSIIIDQLKEELRMYDESQMRLR